MAQEIKSTFTVRPAGNTDLDRVQVAIKAALDALAHAAQKQIASRPTTFLSFVFTGVNPASATSAPIAPTRHPDNSVKRRLFAGDVVVQVLDVTSAPATDAQDAFESTISKADNLKQVSTADLSAHQFALIVARYT